MDGAEPVDVPPLPNGEAGELAAFVRGGGRLAVVTGPTRSGTRAVLDTALWALPELVIRTGNPLTTPLNLSRLLLQVGADPHADDQAASLLAGISTHAGTRSRAVLAIDDAHTLEPEALTVLARLPAPGTGATLGVQLVLAGRHGLMDMLAASGFAGLYDPAASLVLSLDDTGLEDEPPPTAAPKQRTAAAAPFVPSPPPPLVRPVRTHEGDPPEPPRPFPIPVPPVAARAAPGTAPGVTQLQPALPVVPAPTAPLPRRRRPLLVASLAGAAIGVAAGVTGLWLLDKLPFPPPAVFALAPPAVAPPATPVAAAAVASPVPAEAAVAEPPAPAQSPAAPPASASPAETPQAPTSQAPAPAALVPPGLAPPTLAPLTLAPTAPVPTAPAPQAPVAAAPTPVEPLLIVPQVTSEARLRRDFDAFLRRSGWSGTARTPEAREALFRDYKEWLARNRAGPAPTLR